MTASPDGSKFMWASARTAMSANAAWMSKRTVRSHGDRPRNGCQSDIASGIRNPTALAFDPWNEQLWAVVNGATNSGATRPRLSDFRTRRCLLWLALQLLRPERRSRIKPARPASEQGRCADCTGLACSCTRCDFTTDGGLGGRFAEGVRRDAGNGIEPIHGYEVVFVLSAAGARAANPSICCCLKDGHARGAPWA